MPPQPEPQPPAEEKVRKVAAIERVTADKVERHLTLNETTNEGEGNQWDYVTRRVTFDRDTDEQISNDLVAGMSMRKLKRRLDKPRRLKIIFYLDEESDGSSGGAGDISPGRTPTSARSESESP